MPGESTVGGNKYTQECSDRNELHLLLEWHAGRRQNLPAMHQDFAVGSHQWRFASPCELATQPTYQPQQCDNEAGVSSQ